MPARLVVHRRDHPALSFLVRDGSSCLIGRDPSCDLVVDDERISRRHARLEDDGSGWRLVDLDSKNGTWIAGGEPHGRLESGDRIHLGGLDAVFEEVAGTAEDEETGRAASSEASTAAERRWQSSLDLRRRLGAGLEVGELLGRLVESVLEISGAERAFVLLARADGRLETLELTGLDRRDLESEEFSGSLGAIRRTLATGRTVSASDTRRDDFLAERPSVVAAGVRALVCLPLVAMDRTLGVIYADSTRPGARFAPLDLEILEATASHAALALAVARLGAELHTLAADLAARPELGGELSERLGREVTEVWKRSLSSAADASTPLPESLGELASLADRHEPDP